MKIKAMIRLIASILLCVILIPIIIEFYFMISPSNGAEDLETALIKALPMGEQIAYTIKAILSPAEAGLKGTLDHLFSNNLFTIDALILDLAQLYLISTFVLALSSLIQKWFSGIKKGFINALANHITEILFIFTAYLFATYIYDFFIAEVSNLSELPQKIAIYFVAILSFAGGTIALFCGGKFQHSILKTLLKLLESTLAYVMCILLLLSLSPWFLILPMWVIMVWAFYFVDNLLP